MTAYELVVPVELPPGMTPEAFLRQTSVEWGVGGAFGTFAASSLRHGPSLDDLPRFGAKAMRPVLPEETP